MTIIAWLFSPGLLKKYYPLKYKDIITEEARKNDLDPYLIMAMVKVESNFKPKAESGKGAKGLMQVLPDTADWIDDNKGRFQSGTELYDPQTNIALGCWYMKYLLNRYENTEQALAAYNAGHTKVDSWITDDENWEIESMPYPETREFVIKVLRVRDKYKNLYRGEL